MPGVNNIITGTMCFFRNPQRATALQIQNADACNMHARTVLTIVVGGRAGLLLLVLCCGFCCYFCFASVAAAGAAAAHFHIYLRFRGNFSVKNLFPYSTNVSTLEYDIIRVTCQQRPETRILFRALLYTNYRYFLLIILHTLPTLPVVYLDIYL